MSAEATIWNHRGLMFADPSLEKSSFIVFVEFCTSMSLEVKDFSAIMPTAWRGTPIFYLSGVASNALSKAMGLSVADWNRVSYAEFEVRGRSRSHVFVNELRYCPTCLVLGNHSTLFQLPRVAICPIHRQALRTGCYHCGKAIPTTLVALVGNHFYCDSCDRLLATARRHGSLEDLDAHPSVHEFAELRQALSLELPIGESRGRVEWEEMPHETVASRALSDLHRAHAVWSRSPSVVDSVKTKTQAFRLPPQEEGLGTFGLLRIVDLAAIEAFRNLAIWLEHEHSQLLDVPGNIEFVRHSAARIDLRVNAVSAAFWKAACSVGVQHLLRHDNPRLSTKASALTSWLPTHRGAIEILVNQAVLELFAVCLLQNRHLDYGVQVAWSDPPKKAAYMVPWRLRTLPSGEVELEMRCRVDRRSVKRLAARYKDRWLLAGPTGGAFNDLVSASKSSLGSGTTDEGKV